MLTRSTISRFAGLGLVLASAATPAFAAGWLEDMPSRNQAVIGTAFILIFATGSTLAGYALAGVRPGLVVAALSTLLGAPLVFIAATEMSRHLDKFAPIYAIVVLLFLALFNLGRHFGIRGIRRRAPV
jgi:hypothetical protein